MVMRSSTDSSAPACTRFQISASDCSSQARAERMRMSAWARPICTTALSRIGLLAPRGILVLRGLDEIVERAAGDAQRHAGEAGLVAGHRRHAVERARLAAFVRRAGEVAREADGRAGTKWSVSANWSDRRAAQADDVPDVGPRHLAGAHQHGALDRPAVGVGLARAVGQEDRAMGAEPGGVPAARGEGPDAGDLVAAARIRSARAFGPGPQASTARGSLPKISCATGRSR